MARFRKWACVAALGACLVWIAAGTASAQSEWTTNWTGWQLAGGSVGVLLNNSGASLITTFNGQAWTAGVGTQLVTGTLSPAIPAANRWMRIEFTLGGWENALARYPLSLGLETPCGHWAGWQDSKIFGVFRYWHGASENLAGFYFWPSLTTRQIVVVDTETLTYNAWGAGQAFSSANVTRIGLEAPWWDSKTGADWASASTTVHYLGFFSTQAAANAAGNGQAPTSGPSNGAGGDTMTTVPNGLRYIVPSTVSYGVAKGQDSSVWYAEFNRQRLVRMDSQERVDYMRLGMTGAFDLVIDTSDGTQYVGLDLGDNGQGKVVKRTAAGVETDIMTGLTRPRQLALDGSGNVYVVLEGTGEIKKWTKSSGTVTSVWSGLCTPEGIAVSSTGRIYLSLYGGPELGSPGRVLYKEPSGDVYTLATGLWRARGIALNESTGKLYACTEGNESDNGNSGLLVEINTTTGAKTQVLTGIDYPQFPEIGSNGWVYFTTPRDSWVSAYDPSHSTTESTWPTDSNIKLSCSGGLWGPSQTGTKLNLKIGTTQLNGFVTGSGPCHIWVRIPAEYFSLNLNELYTDRCTEDHPFPGQYELPTVDYDAGSGTCLATAVPVRQHTGCRWPMQNPGTCTESAAAGFSESPTAYLVYVKWTSADRIQTVAEPSYKASNMAILNGKGRTWIYRDGTWVDDSQTWLNLGKTNSPVASGANAEVDLGAWGGTSKYIYVLWHKNGTYRPNAARYKVRDYLKNSIWNVVTDQQKHANGSDYGNDTFSGWKLLGNKKTNITPSTTVLLTQDTPVGSSEYLKTDAVLLSDYPIIDNTSPGSSINYTYNPAFSVSSTGPTGVGHHWGLQGNGYQYSTTNSQTWTATFDTTNYTDIPAGNYYVEVSWAYFNNDNVNATNAQYRVKGVTISNSINQNRSATNQGGSFTAGNSMGSWSGFYRLTGSYAHSSGSVINVSLPYSSSRYGTKRLIADMVRLVPAG